MHLHTAARMLLLEHQSNHLFFPEAHQCHLITCWIKFELLMKDGLWGFVTPAVSLPATSSHSVLKPQRWFSVCATHQILSCLRASRAGTVLSLHHLILLPEFLCLPGYPATSYHDCFCLILKVSAQYLPLSEVFLCLPMQRGSCSGILSPWSYLFQVPTLHSLDVVLFNMCLSHQSVSSMKKELGLFVPFSSPETHTGPRGSRGNLLKRIQVFYQELKSHFLLKV